jgi:hypothetical protein
MQRWMRWVITDPRGVDSALADPRPAHSDARSSPERYREPGTRRLRWIATQAPLAPEGRLGIYAEAYFARLLESLTADFPAVRACLDEASFMKLAADYLKAHPSRSYTISEAGARLPEFLGAQELGRECPWLAELAALEWALIEAFYADERAALEPEALHRIAPEQWPGARFELDPSVRILRGRHEVVGLWRARQDEARLAALEPEESSEAWILVFRDEDGDAVAQTLEPGQGRVLEAMARGECLEAICEGLGEGEAPPLMAWFSEWTSSGVIRAIAPGPQGDTGC